MNIFHVILIFLLISLIVYTIFSILFYIKKSTEWRFTLEEYSKALRDKPSITMQERISAAIQLFQMIDMLIDYSIIGDREYEIMLEKKSKKIDIENSVSRISKSVFDYLNPSIFGDVNNIVTDECLMKYIQQKTFIEYFRYVKSNYESMD